VVGAAAGYAALYGVRFALQVLNNNQIPSEISVLRIAALIVIVVILLTVGGVVSIILDPCKQKDAIVAGLAAQAIIKGFVADLRD
jgi:hypothetical protein